MGGICIYLAAKALAEEDVIALLAEDAHTVAELEPYFEPLFEQEQNDLINDTELTEVAGTGEQQPADESEAGKPASGESGESIIEPAPQASGEETSGEEGEEVKRAVGNRLLE